MKILIDTNIILDIVQNRKNSLMHQIKFSKIVFVKNTLVLLQRIQFLMYSLFPENLIILKAGKV